MCTIPTTHAKQIAVRLHPCQKRACAIHGTLIPDTTATLLAMGRRQQEEASMPVAMTVHKHVANSAPTALVWTRQPPPLLRLEVDMHLDLFPSLPDCTA